MAGPNPLINLGSLNRLKGSVIISAFPQLNISAPYLTKEGIRLAIEGDTTQMLPQLVSMVQSQEVYLKASLVIGLVKTTALATLYLAQIQNNSNVGDVTFYTDTSNLPPFQFSNCAVEGFEGIDASGTNASFPVRIAGTWYVNSSLFSLN
jgi:hypothetical protein